MKNWSTFLIFTLLAALRLDAGMVADFLEDLQDEDKLLIRYDSRGCFHTCIYNFTISKSDKGNLRVSVDRLFDNSRGIEEPRGFVGILVLGDQDTQRLTNLFKVYDDKPSSMFSSTIDRIDIAIERSASKVREVQVVDESNSTADRLDVVSFSELVSRVRISKQESS